METLGIGSRVEHPQFGQGVVIQVRSDAYEIVFWESGAKTLNRDYDGLTVVEATETPSDMATYERIEKSLVKVLNRFSDISQKVEMGSRWNGGRMVLYPSDCTAHKEKEIPLEAFFHKVVMLRDRLRTLEQKINAHAKLTDEEKVDMEQYITRIYGSLTTFNLLFKNDADRFIGVGDNR
ncbi:MAG: hypothetical protein LBS63_05965 [Prevotellaceae bacterium]|jgi:hypothetical protein|nr:hypothetical protein [Prevotellaceae bacterium]